MCAERERAGYLEGVVSIVVNVLLFIVKFYYGLLFNSIAVIADAIHTLSDSLTSAILIVGFRIAYRRPDYEHPFGHGRAELIASLIIGVVLGFVAYELSVESYRKLLEASTLVFSLILVIILAFSALVKELLAQWAFRLADKYNSQSIRGDAWHHRSDALVTGILAIAIFIGSKYWWFDGAAGLALSLIIFYVAIKLVFEASSELLGKAPEKNIIEKIIYIAKNASPTILSVHHIHVHKYGEHVEVTLHVDLPDTITLEEAHKIATLVEEKIKSELGYETTVHVEPVTSKHKIKHED
jgi:cation diffusion facilitator family transporter